MTTVEGRRTTQVMGLRHESRTLVHQIIGFAELLLESVRSSGRVGLELDLERIRDAGHRLVQLLEDQGGQRLQRSVPLPPCMFPV